jgi:hypothetical protein
MYDDPSLDATLYTVGGVGKLYQRRSTFLLSFRCADYNPIRIGGEQERLVLGSRFTRDDKEPEPQLGGETIIQRTAS